MCVWLYRCVCVCVRQLFELSLLRLFPCGKVFFFFWIVLKVMMTSKSNKLNALQNNFYYYFDHRLIIQIELNLSTWKLWFPFVTKKFQKKQDENLLFKNEKRNRNKDVSSSFYWISWKHAIFFRYQESIVNFVVTFEFLKFFFCCASERKSLKRASSSKYYFSSSEDMSRFLSAQSCQSEEFCAFSLSVCMLKCQDRVRFSSQEL